MMKAVRVSNRVITLKNGKKCWVVIKNAQRNKQFLWLQVEKVSNGDFKESEHPRDDSGQFTSKGGSDGVGSIPEKGSKKEIKKNYSFGNVPNVNMDDFFSFNPDDYEDYPFDDFLKDSGLKKSERNFIKGFFENPIVKISGQNKKKEIFENYKKGELHTEEDVLFNLFDLGVEQESSKEFAEQLGMADVKYIKDLLYSAMIKYPEMLHYSDTLGLDVLTVKKSEKSSKDVTNGSSKN